MNTVTLVDLLNISIHNTKIKHENVYTHKIIVFISLCSDESYT